MRKQGFGKIINIASLGGLVPMPGEAVYSATKFGIRGYSLSLAAELRGSPLEITVIAPDSVDTPQLAYELEHDEAVMSFLGTPLPAEKVARRIVKAITKNKREVLIPAGTGVLCRAATAFPGLFFALLPFIKRIGGRNIARRRREMDRRGDSARAAHFEAKR